MSTENRVDDDEKVVIHRTFHDVLGIGQAFQSIVLLCVCIGIPMMCALTCTGKWDSFFDIFKK